jgi:glycosyltransferase involved in cell wall biosynthesis
MNHNLSELIIMPSGQERGGAEEALLQYVSYRAGQGVRSRIVLLERGTLAQALTARGAIVSEIPAGRLRNAWRWMLTVSRIVRIARRERPDLILAWMVKGHAYGGVAGLILGVPGVYYQFGLPDLSPVDRVCRLVPATGAIGCSNFATREQQAKVRCPVLSVPLAADIDRFEKVRHLSAAQLKRQFGFDPEQPLIGIVGRLQRWKGMHVFAEAMARVIRSRPGCQGVIVGGPHDLEPEYAKWLQERVRALGLQNKLALVGKQTNVPEWMQAMDIFVHASDREPFGIVVLEAMSLGKPVIATKPGGPEEIIEDQKNGILVPFGDAGAVGDAILTYLSQPAFAARIGSEARQRALSLTPEVFGSRLVESLNVLRAGPKRATSPTQPGQGRLSSQRFWPGCMASGRLRHQLGPELIITPSGQDRGGAEQSLLQYVRARQGSGGRVPVVALERGFLVDALSSLGAEVIYIEGGRLRHLHKWIAAIWRIATEARKRKSRLILSWQTKAHLYGSPAALLAGIPAVYFQRGLPDSSMIDRLCRSLPAAGALCCSDYVARLQQERISYRAIGIPSPADIDRFAAIRSVSSESLKAKFGFAPKQPLVGIVGRLQRWKGVHVFVEAMTEVFENIPICQAVIVGGPHDLEPDYAIWLAAEIQRRGLEDRVRMVGKQRNVPEWMQAMDVIVHASDREPFGIVVVEAMALGKPVIATKPGGPEEIIEHKKSGLLIPFNDPHALAGAVLFYLHHPAVAREMGETARQRSELFSPDRYLEKVMQAIGELTGQQTPSAV